MYDAVRDTFIDGAVNIYLRRDGFFLWCTILVEISQNALNFRIFKAELFISRHVKPFEVFFWMGFGLFRTDAILTISNNTKSRYLSKNITQRTVLSNKSNRKAVI